MNKEIVLGVKVCITNCAQFVQAIKKDIEQGRKSFVVAINPEKIMKARADESIRGLLNSAEYPIPDGVGVILASKINGGQIKERITGIKAMELLCDMACRNGYNVFLYGAKKDVVEKAKERIADKYVGINIVGYLDGYTNNDEQVVQQINGSNADILFVALGSLEQERFIARNKGRLCATICQGVGGSFDVISGYIKRAPTWMQKCGLEWFYRLLKQPSRISRQLRLIGFLFAVIFSKKNPSGTCGRRKRNS
jgi:N-acetylglucosaminyldiphosphoundecaprenol N-acetyl-beta-D-mannosaminyltransferase